MLGFWVVTGIQIYVCYEVWRLVGNLKFYKFMVLDISIVLSYIYSFLGKHELCIFANILNGFIDEIERTLAEFLYLGVVIYAFGKDSCAGG